MIRVRYLYGFAILIPILLLVTNPAFASGCGQNASPSVDCSDLSVNSNTNLITIDAGITVSSESANAFEMRSGSVATLDQLVINGTIDVPSGAGGNTAIVNRDGNTISSIIISTSGVVQGQWASIYNEWGPATIGSITNLGVVTATQTNYSMYNDNGVIGTLNNLQSSDGVGGALHYSGKLPTNYNVIVYGDQFGQLAVNSGDYSGSMMFDVFAGDVPNGIAASTLNTRVYEDVVTGVVSSAYSNTFVDGAAFGSYNGFAWKLTNAEWRGGSSTSWDLTVLNFGLELGEPQRTVLGQEEHSIRDGLDHRMGYDCVLFDKDDFCVSLDARYSGSADGRELAGILTVAKQIEAGVRIGGFLDARLSSNEVDGVQMKSGLPMFGLFAAYSAHQDGTGLHARFSAAYEHGTADITRSNMLGSAATVSGTADVDSYGIAQRFGWGFDVGNKKVLTPYLGLRLTESTRGAYDEAYSEGVVDDPFSYDAYGQKRTTGTLGADLAGPIDQNTTYRLGAGLDYDVASNLDMFAAYSDLIGDMTYSNDVKARATRFFGSAGIGHMLEKNKTLTLDAQVSQMDYGSESAYSLIAGYQMAF